jgi:hypothetical protein
MVRALQAGVGLAVCLGSVTLARAQITGAELTVFPGYQGEGSNEFWVTQILGISEDGDTAALTTARGTVANNAWLRRGVGILELPATSFVWNNVVVPAWFLGITADGSHAVGGFRTVTGAAPTAMY